MVKVTRKTTESQIIVTLNNNGLSPNYRDNIKTPIPFLSHMIEHIAWRSGLNITTEVNLANFNLSHVVCEDLGITLGKAIAEYLKRNTQNGLRGYGEATGIIDEARAQAAISFESRAYLDFDLGNVTLPSATEGMQSEDILTFIEGLVQGAACTMHIELKKGVNGHHIWEAVYRAIGMALGSALAIDETRAGKTAGVAGEIKFIIE